MQSDCSGQYGLQVLRLLVSELQGPHLFTSGRVNRLLTPSKCGGLYLQEVAINKPTEVLESQRLQGELKCLGLGSPQNISTMATEGKSQPEALLVGLKLRYPSLVSPCSSCLSWRLQATQEERRVSWYQAGG